MTRDIEEQRKTENPPDIPDFVISALLKRLKNYLLSPVLIWIVVFQVIGIGIGLTSDVNSEWFQDLIKSPLQPPGAAFGTAWTILYFLLAFVGYNLSVAKDDDKKKLFIPFIVQMVLNWSWNPIFFNAQQPEVSLVVIIVMVFINGYITINLWDFKSLDKYLMVPYVLWLVFATYLNAFIVINN